MAWLYLGTATFSLIVNLVPHTPHVHGWPRWLMLGGSYALGLGLLAGRRTLPDDAVDFALAAGVGLVTLSLALKGNGSAESFPVFYLWAALAAAFLLTRRRAALQIGLIAVSYAVFLRDARVTTHVAAHQWLLTVGTAILAAGIVSALRGRVERLIGDLAETSKRDPRTGLLNGAGLEELIERELERAQRSEGRLSLVVCDLDRFKAVNEELGHRAADAHLQTVADVLDRTKRRIDVVARLSGQVFALLLPDTDEHGAYVLADRLRRAVRDSFASGSAPITASLGVASFPKHGGTYEELYGSATRAVYVAKELGRDRSVIYNPEISANLRSAAARDGMQAEEHLAAVIVLAETLDMRDTSTARHSETVARYAKLIAGELGLSDREIERVHLAGMLHDIGKIGISDNILQKPGSLNQAEWEEMRKHPELGSRILDGARLEDISAWVRAHHERPDGRGYPLGLADDEIPLQAKILAVADSYEAMTAERVYKTAMSHTEAQAELLRCCGSQFDPAVVHAFATALAREQRAGVAEAIA
ncbi:MAG: bifunctional diguanylate cyclase/phosphohydrolase [Thermoleophilaceae bacterium]